MCYRQMAIRSVSPQGQKFSFVPCGHCEECRDKSKLQWQFRLRCELDFCRSNNWHIAFFTLTYDDAHLPTFDDSFYRSLADVPSTPVACFSRSDVRLFVDNIRKRLHERYGVKSLRYMVCSEFGSSENTRRPHYHGIVSFPPDVPPREMFDLVHDQWKRGFVFPRYFEGGFDSHGYKHSPFIVDGDTQFAAVYASKYCCKDLNFVDSIKSLNFVDKHEEPQIYALLKDCMPFHIQSRSIGLSYLSTLTVQEMLDLLKNGESFAGQLKRKPLPLYIKNKILFNPWYEYVERISPDMPVADWWYDFECDKWRFKKGQGTHCRRVLRVPTQFMVDNYRELYNQRREYYRAFFDDISHREYWTARKIDSDVADKLVGELSKVDSLDNFVDFFVGYYGVLRSKYVSLDPARQWITRYCPLDCVPDLCGDFSRVVDSSKFVLYESVVKTVCSELRFAVAYDIELRKERERIKDFYKHLA